VQFIARLRSSSNDATRRSRDSISGTKEPRALAFSLSIAASTCSTGSCTCQQPSGVPVSMIVQRISSARSCRRSSSSRHTAHEQLFKVVVRYPHHPLAGQRIAVIRCLKFAHVPHFVIQGPDGCRALLPVWMTEHCASSLSLVEPPRLSIDALQA